jgi:hypothetical protein
MSVSPVISSAGAANWLAGDKLALVLHIGDGPLAYELSERGHEVTIVGDDVREARAADIGYVRCSGGRLPFRPRSFDVVVAPELREAPAALGEYARVLTDGGVLSTMTRRYDNSIPWLRKLRAITGDADGEIRADTFSASGLFAVAETREFSAWQEIDLPQLMSFAENTRRPDVPVEQLAQVERLWSEYGAATGSLRLRLTTFCARARVDKTALPYEPEPAGIELIDLS